MFFFLSLWVDIYSLYIPAITSFCQCNFHGRFIYSTVSYNYCCITRSKQTWIDQAREQVTLYQLPFAVNTLQNYNLHNRASIIRESLISVWCQCNQTLTCHMLDRNLIFQLVLDQLKYDECDGIRQHPKKERQEGKKNNEVLILFHPR